MTLQQLRCNARPHVAFTSRGLVRAFEQQIGDAAKRRGDNDDRPGMTGDESGGFSDGGRIGQRCASEFPDFEVAGHLTCDGPRRLL
jgi:hypothetical protein